LTQYNRHNSDLLSQFLLVISPTATAHTKDGLDMEHGLGDKKQRKKLGKESPV